MTRSGTAHAAITSSRSTHSEIDELRQEQSPNASIPMAENYDDARIHQAIAFMRVNLHLTVSTEDLARLVNLSPSRLRFLFKSETGLSLTQFHKQLKMERAKELLANEFITVRQVMNVLGINDDSHFTRDFKKAYGLSPGQYCRSRFKSMPSLDEK